jgi:hypothetical protein
MEVYPPEILGGARSRGSGDGILDMSQANYCYTWLPDVNTQLQQPPVHDRLWRPLGARCKFDHHDGHLNSERS